MNWILDPDTYSCPTHGVDLTRQVLLEATAEGTVVVGGGGGDGFDAADAERVDVPFESPEGPFVVVITCPGKRGRDGAKAEPHEQQFSGVVNRG